MGNEIDNIFEHEHEEEEKCICEDCGETKYLQFGVCIKCGGNVIEVED